MMSLMVLLPLLLSCALHLPSLTSSLEFEDNCPAASDITPCKCKPNYDGACVIQCAIANEQQLERLASIPNLCGGHVHFILVHSIISGIPTSLWRVLLSSATIDVTVQYSHVANMIPPGDPDLPYVHSPGGGVIKVVHTSNISKWEWSHLKRLSTDGDFTVIIDDTDFTTLPDEFSLIAGGRVSKVTIDGSNLTSLPDQAFAPFSLLNSLSIQNNKLTEVKRSMIPWPAFNLKYLHLNGNLLSSVPEDLFVAMPTLEIVYLRENKLTSLPDNIFTLATSSKFQLLDFVRNPWHCDCRLMWLVKHNELPLDLGTCATPSQLADVSVRDLPQKFNCN